MELRQTFRINKDGTEERVGFKDLKIGDEFKLFEDDDHFIGTYIAIGNPEFDDKDKHYGIIADLKE